LEIGRYAGILPDVSPSQRAGSPIEGMARFRDITAIQQLGMWRVSMQMLIGENDETCKRQNRAYLSDTGINIRDYAIKRKMGGFKAIG